MKEYMITKEQCQATIDSRKPIICTRCGGKITPIETIDNADNPTHRMGCLKCQCFNTGTTPKTFAIANRLFENRNMRAYHYEEEPDKLRTPELYQYWRGSQISGIVGIVVDVLRIKRELDAEPARTTIG